MPPLDIGPVLDDGRWTGYLKFLVSLAALAVVFDGADLQLFALAIPAMTQEWMLPRSAFAPVVMVGMIGMMIGGAAVGLAGDRMGRKLTLVVSMFVFGLATAATAWVNGVIGLGAWRFIAGIGLGGALPNAVALASEYVPRRHRPFAVTLAIVCVPLGGMLAAFTASHVLPSHGWRTLFVIGGVAPLIFAFGLIRFMPESPRYLVRQPARWPELSALLRRMRTDLPAATDFVDSREQATRRSPLAALFATEYRRDTTALWMAFLACLLAVYLCFNWLPALLASAGLNGSDGLLAFNLGGVAGAIAGAGLITRFGSRAVMMSLAGAAVAAAASFALVPLVANAPTLPIWSLLVLTGAMINGVQVALYALAAHVYPVVMRATGVGSAASFGRIGGVLSSYVGAWAIQAGGSRLYFGFIAAAMLVCLVALAIAQRHIATAGSRT